jgi:hypothetical protein
MGISSIEATVILFASARAGKCPADVAPPVDKPGLAGKFRPIVLLYLLPL